MNNSTDAPWTIGRLLNWTTDYLKQRGAESPRLDAEVLLAEARHCQRIELYTAFDEPAAEPVRIAFRELVRRRAEGTPVAYLVGRREFYSLMFRVTPDVLIPRPETELLLVRLLDLAKDRAADAGPPSIADVGTGSGILAVCAAKNLGAAQVVATDVSERALDVGKSNADKHGVAERIEWYQGDLLSSVPAERQFDFIVANLPYIRTDEMQQLEPTVKDFEPRLALEAGPEGTELIARLIPQAAERLRPAGWLLLEISPTIEQAARNLFASEPRLELGLTIKDLAGHARVLEAQRK